MDNVQLYTTNSTAFVQAAMLVVKSLDTDGSLCNPWLACYYKETFFFLHKDPCVLLGPITPKVYQDLLVT